MSSGNKTICIIGGGVAGLLAAVTAADEGASVKLFEKMSKVGLKMGITGKGRCNLTNSAPIMDFIAKTPGNGKFLYSAYEKFNNEDLLDLLHGWGLKTKVERGGRVFPASDDAQEVRHLFMDLLRKKKVELHLDESVTRILTKDGEVSGIVTDKGSYGAGAVILCTGGSSYPRTGSTGDGYRMARELGHKVTAIRPALIPLVCKESYGKELQGLSLKNVSFSIDAGGRRKASEFGEMLFTHFGVSGPIVLMLSDKASLWLSQGHEIKASIDLKPALTEDVLDKRVLRDLETYHETDGRRSPGSDAAQDDRRHPFPCRHRKRPYCQRSQEGAENCACQNDESHAAHRDGDASDFGSHRYGRGRFRQGNQSVHDGIQSG